MKTDQSITRLLRPARLWPLLPVLLFLAASHVRAGVETFDDGSNNGDWHLTTAPATIEPDGGNPGPYLHATADAAVPSWFVPLGTQDTKFLGDYAARHVVGLSVDIDIFAGLAVPDRNVTLDLQTTRHTGDYSRGIEAYYIGRDISELPTGWHTYAFRFDAASPTIPPGWVVTRGDGTPGTDADWQTLMGNVETLAVELGTPGYFYPFWEWDLGLDNCRLVETYQ